jgi:hypothetical protein
VALSVHTTLLVVAVPVAVAVAPVGFSFHVQRCTCKISA